jgi:uncharacterized protein (TIGR03000 family)
MSRRVALLMLLGFAGSLMFATSASARGRRCGGRQAACCSPCAPCCPAPCHPCFTFCARLKNPSGLVNPEAALPIEIILTNHEPYRWHYHHSEYGFHVFDEHGHYVPSALILATIQRTIWVPPCASILDEPPGIYLNMKVLQLERRYTLLVTLRGRQSCLHFTPFLEFSKKKASATAPATIVVTLPEEAALTINGDATVSTSGTRTFLSPALEKGKSYFYTLKARAVVDGATRELTRQVRVHAGERTDVRLDFGATATASR